MRNNIITLSTQYKEGKTISEKTVDIFAEKKSLTRSEFYAGLTAGVTGRYVFDVDPGEYYLADVTKDGVVYHATHVYFEGVKLNIIRTYEKDFSSMELTVG